MEEAGLQTLMGRRSTASEFALFGSESNMLMLLIAGGILLVGGIVAWLAPWWWLLVAALIPIGIFGVLKLLDD
ncbi:hypothetical protein N9261_00540 [bacterium]|nr:hypothetical protein [bacterium]